MKILMIVFTAFAFLFSCGNENSGTKASTLIHDIWALNDLGDKSYELYEGQRPTIEIQPADKKAFGNSGCNNFTGSIETLTENKLQFGPLASTRKACPGNTAEADFLGMLDQVRTYKIENLTLTFFNEAGDKIASFKKVD